MAWVCGGETPHVYEWAAHPPDGTRPPPVPVRQRIDAVRGAQQGDPLGPLLHAVALSLLLQRLSLAFPDKFLRADLHDVVIAGPVEFLGPFMTKAAEGRSAVDAELAPAKCVA